MKNPRVLLLYISEVSGHHSATIAIEHALRALVPGCSILNINAFHYTNPISEKIVNRVYMGVIKRTPKLWDYLYDNPAVIERIDRFRKAIHKHNTPKFKKLFDEFRPDVVVCTQAFPCGMVADFKAHYRNPIPLLAVLTDFIPHSYWLYDTVDYYIVPSDDVGARLIKKGVSPEKIRPFGIPFNHAFNEPVDREKVFLKLKLDPSQTTVLLMGGGQGIGPLRTVLSSLERAKITSPRHRKDIQIVVVAGTNKKLYKSIKRRARRFRKKIVVFSYTPMIRELMSIADILITKPGGITTSEALAKKLAMLIIKPIPGQEVSNTHYLTTHHAALKVDNPRRVHHIVEELIDAPARLHKLSDAAGRISKPNASMDIARFILSLANAPL
jgi:processive 1,2-diacylglycerol beta-glucosyltransferase